VVVIIIVAILALTMLRNTITHFKMSNKKKRKSKKRKTIIQQGARKRSHSSKNINLRKTGSSTEVYPVMRREINSWDRHAILMFNHSRRM
jgi:hypothetical protein